MQYAIGTFVDNPQETPRAISTRSFFMGLGQFFSAYLLVFLSNLFHVPGGRGEWKIAVMICVLSSLLMFLMLFSRKKINMKGVKKSYV